MHSLSPSFCRCETLPPCAETRKKLLPPDTPPVSPPLAAARAVTPQSALQSPVQPHPSPPGVVDTGPGLGAAASPAAAVTGVMAAAAGSGASAAGPGFAGDHLDVDAEFLNGMRGSPRRLSSAHRRAPSGSGASGSAGSASPAPPVAHPAVDHVKDRFHRSHSTGSPRERRHSPAHTPSSRGSVAGIRWRKGGTIGKGAYGAVFLGLNEDSGELMAVKEIHFSSRDQREIVALQTEIDLMRSLKHQHIVRYLGTEVRGSSLYIFTEWVSGGSLERMLQRFQRLAEKVVAKYTRQLLVGLAFLHSHDVVHRDIKGANILVDDRGTIKLADFGASKKVPPIAKGGTEETTEAMGAVRPLTSINKSLRGTPYFMAPEVIQQVSYNFKADIWSVGGTVLQMATGKVRTVCVRVV